MFFRVLSAMLTADAIDRHIRTPRPRHWDHQGPPNHEAETVQVSAVVN